jgi:antagonist of KipI
MALPEHLRPILQRETIRFVPRGDVDLADTWTISAASDRTGYRLEGTPLPGGGSVTSEPVTAGVVQVPPDGKPVVLMADSPTVGGYRIAGAVATADIGALAQCVPGTRITFERIAVADAQRLLADSAARVAKAREWAAG